MIPLTVDHKMQLDDLIDDTIMPAFDEDFEMPEDATVEEVVEWQNKALNHLIKELKERI
jgi:hypothetical protein